MSNKNGEYSLGSGWSTGVDGSTTSLYDEDGNTVFAWWGYIPTSEEAHHVCEAWRSGFSRGKATGEVNTKAEIRKVLGL